MLGNLAGVIKHIHAGTNIKNSNNDFKFKSSLFKEDKWVKIPANSDEVGIESYRNFTFIEIIERTLDISNLIASKFKNTWDDI